MRVNLSCFSTNIFRKSLPCALVASMGLVLVGCSSGGGSDSADLSSDFEPGDEISESESGSTTDQIDGGSDSAGLPSGFEPSDEITESESGSIIDQIRDDIDFGRLLGLLQQADLEGPLEGDNEGLGWTLFAPQDLVFDQDAEFQDLTTIAQQVDRVRGLVASGIFDFSDLVPGSTITLQDGNEALVELAPDGASLVVGGAVITMEGRVVSNGVIHRVNSLITTE